MRRPVTGLLLTLILLAVAIPAVVSCCFGPPSGRGTHPQPPRAAYAAAAAFVAVQQAAQQAAQAQGGDTAVRGCADHPAPPQTPYIETNSSTGGAGTVTSRNANAGIDASASRPSATIVPAHRHGAAADDTGPPLWLTTCVSRT
jgi:hypothetical protein